MLWLLQFSHVDTCGLLTAVAAASVMLLRQLACQKAKKGEQPPWPNFCADAELRAVFSRGEAAFAMGGRANKQV